MIALHIYNKSLQRINNLSHYDDFSYKILSFFDLPRGCSIIMRKPRPFVRDLHYYILLRVER